VLNENIIAIIHNDITRIIFFITTDGRAITLSTTQSDIPRPMRPLAGRPITTRITKWA
jgi:hypothetical protein